MKKLIYTILASSFLLSCSSDSSNDDSNNPMNGLLVKTVTYVSGSSSLTDVYSYNGNKINGWVSSDGGNTAFTYDGDYIINLQISQPTNINPNSNWLDNANYAYTNGVLSSSNEHWSQSNPIDFFRSTISSSFSYNSDGTRIENQTITLVGGAIYHIAYKDYYFQGNHIKREEYNTDNSPMTLNSITTYTYDSKNFPFKNITGFNFYENRVNNQVGYTVKDDGNNIIETCQMNYQYNSQDYPTSLTRTSTRYTIDPQTGTSTPNTPITYTENYTYY
jgi:hypothetical protein